MRVALEPATAADAGAIGTIVRRWIDETPWMPKIHAAGGELEIGRLLIDRTEVTVARTGDRIAGFVACQGHEVQALYLAPDARGRGVGARLLATAAKGRDRLGLWTFQANTGARRFYSRQGFREVRMTDGRGNDEKLPDVRLEWARGEA